MSEINLLQRMTKRLVPFSKRFSESEGGTIIFLAAFILPIALMVGGMGIDYSNSLRVRQAMSSALDAALLATAKELSLGSIRERDVNERVNDYFDAGMSGFTAGGVTFEKVSTQLDSDAGKIAGQANADVDVAFANLLGVNDIAVGVDGQATYNQLDVELSLVLDITGSMAGSKLKDMKGAAQEVVDLLLTDDNAGSDGLAKVRISIVPYSDLVNVGTFEEQVTGYSSGESCVYERKYSNVRNDKAPKGRVPGVRDNDDNGQVDTTGGGCALRPAKGKTKTHPLNFKGFMCPNETLMPLSEQRAQLKQKIDSLQAVGCTAGHIGIEWGWYTLSPNFGDIWPAGSQPRPYSDKDNLKALVVMTDGSFNTWYEQGNGSSYNQGEALCDSIKRNGVRIYTVAFKAPGGAKTFLRQCASGPQYYFESSTGSALKDAFREIANQLRALRLSS
jgi:Flp pilus assembly protein TadG